MNRAASITRHVPAAVAAILEEGPEWLRRMRARAWEVYLRTPMPGPRDEAWRRTSLAGLDLDALLSTQREEDADAVPPVPAGSPGEPAGTAGHLVQTPPAVAHHTLASEAAEQGVIFTDLLTAASAYPDLVGRHLGALIPAEESKFAALNAALWQSGLFVYVPAGVEVRLPLWSTVCCAGAPAALHRTLVVAEAGSSVSCVETVISTETPPLPGRASAGGATAALHCGVVEIFAAPGARVRYGALQGLAPAMWSFSFRRARAGRESRVDQFAGEFGGRLVRSETHAALEEEGAVTRTAVAYYAAEHQHIDVTAGAVHRAGRTESEIVARGAVSGEARAVYRGLGHILRGAKGAAMSQKQRALLLSRAARADTIPGLFIDENDVAASHAAAAAPLDGEPLFYLMSRGIDEDSARRMMVHGFFRPLLEQIPLDAVRTGVEAILDEKLGAR